MYVIQFQPGYGKASRFPGLDCSCCTKSTTTATTQTKTTVTTTATTNTIMEALLKKTQVHKLQCCVLREWNLARLH